MRVIAGELRGRRLSAPTDPGVRPTSERVREAVFDILFSLGGVEGMQVADLFAGSGAMGIEALSRGAASVTFVDSNPTALTALRANLASLGLGQAEGTGDVTVIRADVTTWVPTTASRYDLILCDPPYDFDGWESLVGNLPGDLAVLESGVEIDTSAGLGSHKIQAVWGYHRDGGPP